MIFVLTVTSMEWYQVFLLLFTLLSFLPQCQHDNEERMKRLERYKTDAEKRKRVQRKRNRAEEQELRLEITVLSIIFVKAWYSNNVRPAQSK